MTDLERLQAWLETYPRAGELTSYQVDYELLRKVAEKNYWKNLTVNFIAKKPARI